MGLRTVVLSSVWSALDRCLPGYRVVEKVHHWWVYSSDATFPPYMRLAKGAHGSRFDPRIESGHVRTMARHFGILECMVRETGSLR